MVKNEKKRLAKKEIKEYDREVMERAKKFKLKQIDFHNLYDLFYMADNPPELMVDFKETLKLNKMDKWFNEFHARVEKVVFGNWLSKNKTKRKL